MKQNVIKEKSFRFALQIIEVYKKLQEQKEYVLSKQLLRSGTSIGANVEEAIQAQSKSDFIHKFSIAQKEAFETDYWIRLLIESGYLQTASTEALLNDCREIQKIITAILLKSKSTK